MLLPDSLQARIEWAAARRGRSVPDFLDHVLERYGTGVDETGLPSSDAIRQAITLIEDAGGAAVLPEGYDPDEDGMGGRLALRE